MKYLYLALALAAVFPSFIATGGCGGDDDDTSDDDVVDDDTSDDDTADDDSVDDDSSDDDTIDDDTVDDDTLDDDSSDDDTHTAEEPVAILACPKACVDTDQAVAFDASGSYDLNGETLTYALDFGDGQSADTVNPNHSYVSAGAFLVRLLVTNDSGLSDATSCVVRAGDPQVTTPSLDTIDLKTTYYDDAITEPFDHPLHGGHVFGYFVAPFDAIPDGIYVNGEKFTYDTEGEPGPVHWCEVVPQQLQEGKPGIVRCYSESADFDPGENVTLAVKEGETTIWSKTQALAGPSLTPTFITATMDNSEILIHVLNETDADVTVDGLSINGVEFTDFAVMIDPVLSPGETGIMHVPYCDGVPYHEWMIFNIRGSGAKAAEQYSVTRALRLFEPRFFLGNWNSGDGDVFNDPENALPVQLDAGIDTFLWNGVDPSPATVFQVAEDYDINVWTHVGGTSPEFEASVETWGDNPHWIGNAVKGEGDSENPMAAMEKLWNHRDLWPHQRLWIYNNIASYFSRWGQMADLSGMDHYCVWAAKANLNWPIGYWDHIEFLGRYSEVIRRAAEPAPIWLWTQSIWNTFDTDEGQVRCTTDDEFRVQWYQVIAYGAKSIWYFYYRRNWVEDCGDPDVVAEHAKVADELRQFDRVLLEGHPTRRGESLATTANESVDINTVVASDALLIVMTNFDYDLKYIGPWEWTGQKDVVVTLTPPTGFEPASFGLIDGDGKIELPFEKSEDGIYRFTLPSLPVAEAVLVTPEP
ncbi:MAG: PKD domain-containing protein [Deltaproteobacteria bacterium]|nr:PKD domain-containing protein [Deltaproteobacteria bacterium]